MYNVALEIRKRMSSLARQRVHDRYSHDIARECLAGFYEKEMFPESKGFRPK
jgi:hypothetical protein